MSRMKCGFPTHLSFSAREVSAGSFLKIITDYDPYTQSLLYQLEELFTILRQVRSPILVTGSYPTSFMRLKDLHSPVNMEGKYKLIPDISPADNNWTAKVIVVEKSPARTAQYSPTKYQNITLMDLEKNKVQATIYDTNIQAFEDQLVPSKTYLISNAAVKPTKQQYRSWMGDVQWTISGRTKVDQIQEDHTALLSSTYDFISFEKLEKYMDSKVDISIIGVALDIKPKRLIQTRFGTQSYIQDVVLINESFETVLLTMWENFVDKECTFISDHLTRKLIVIGTHLKVSSFNGLSISTKTNSSFLFDPPFHQAMQLRYWVEQNVDKLDDMILKKEYLARTPAKLSTPTRDKLTLINNIPGLLAVQSYFWVEARAHILISNQAFWYMSCDNCNKISNASSGELYHCIYCKSTRARATPRARVFLQLEDSTGSMEGTMIGDTAEMFLQRSAKRLMELASSGDQNQILDEIRITVEENHLFYIKAIKKDSQMDRFKYDIIFMMETSSLGTINELENLMDDGSNVGFVPGSSIGSSANSSVSPPLSSTVKRMLFETPVQSTPTKRPVEEHVTAETPPKKTPISSKEKVKIMEAK